MSTKVSLNEALAAAFFARLTRRRVGAPVRVTPEGSRTSGISVGGVGWDELSVRLGGRNAHALARRAAEYYWSSLDGAQETLEAMEGSASRAPYATTVASAHILRKVDPGAAAHNLKRLLNQQPTDFLVRYALAKTLSLSADPGDQLEGFKQRLIGQAIDLGKTLRRLGPGSNVNGVLARHDRDTAQIRLFLDGCGTGSHKSSTQSETPAIELPTGHLDRLSRIPDRADFPSIHRPPPRVRVVVDTNALTHADLRAAWRDERVGFIAPAEVLYELAAWQLVDRIPWGFHYVRIATVNRRVPPEVEQMLSRKKGRPPSRTDKLVATLAIENRTHAILTDDRDIWDTSVAYDIAKNTGLELAIIRPKDFTPWLDKHAPLPVQGGTRSGPT